VKHEIQIHACIDFDNRRRDRFCRGRGSARSGEGHPSTPSRKIQIKEGDTDAYVKAQSPKAQAALKSIAGSQLIAAGTATKIEGEPRPRGTRVTIRRYNSMEDAKAAFSSPEYREARKIGDKYATFRVFATEGVSQ